MHKQRKSFRHIRERERERVEELLQERKTHADIAYILGRNISTIYREVVRNCRVGGSYTAGIRESVLRKGYLPLFYL